jgi:hypothetical protein
MEIGAFFILIIVFILFAVLGGGLYAVAMWLRHKKLDPEEDKLEGPGEETEGHARPEHVKHGKAQRARFVGSR